MVMIRLENIRKSYGGDKVKVEVLKGLNMTVDNGELLAILGASGCGKSTLMNIMGFLDVPTSGRYFFQDQDLASLSDRELSTIRNQKIGFVFQQFNLLPKLTAHENVCLPLVYRGVSLGKRREKAARMLELVGMADRMEHKPSELSGGQQQRVAIARALVGDPDLILADEPTGALDTKVGGAVFELFLRLNAEQHLTTVLITHDPGLAAKCKRQVRMVDGLVFDMDGGKKPGAA
ncbi:MAG: ABC transporter ATP-binding protein [Pseudodesulfovibrio sp.]